MKKRNIFPRKGETISDEQLDERVAQIIEKYPELGIVMSNNLLLDC